MHLALSHSKWVTRTHYLLMKQIAIWTPAEFPQSLPLTERCQQMLAKLEDCSQRDFIEVCLDSNIHARHKMKRLINHPAVTEVPILKLLSAKVIVENSKSFYCYGLVIRSYRSFFRIAFGRASLTFVVLPENR